MQTSTKSHSYSIPRLKLIFIVHCLLIPALLSAQLPAEIDSLRGLLPEKDPPEQTDLLIDIAEQFKFLGQKDSMLHYAQNALQLAEQHRLKRQKALSQYFIGQFYLNSDTDEYERWTQSALELSQEIGYRYGTVMSYMGLGKLNRYLGKTERTIELYQLAEIEARQLVAEDSTFSNYQLLGRLKMNISVAYKFMNQYRPAIAAALEGGEIARKLGDTELEFRMVSNLGAAYNELSSPLDSLGSGASRKQHVARARVYLFRSLELAKKLNNQRYVSVALNNIALNYSDLGQMDTALIYLNQSAEIDLQQKNFKSHAVALNNIGIIHCIRKDYKKGIETFKASIASGKRSKLAGVNNSAFSNLAGAYFNTNQYDKGFPLIEKAMASNKKIKKIKALSNNYETLYLAYSRRGDYKEAFTYLKLYNELVDTMMSEKHFTKIEELETRYETTIKEQQISDLTKQSQIQSLQIDRKNLQILLAIIVGLAFAIFLFLFNRQRIMKEKQNTLEINHQLLRSQMNPHFMFNALSAIQSFFYDKKDSASASIYLSKFSKLMRLILENSRSNFVPLDQEIETLENYLSLQRVRFSNKFEYTINCDPALSLHQTQIPPMLAQPFLENALEHGLIHKRESGHVSVQFAKQSNTLKMTIEDNGIGIKKARQQKNGNHESLATRITRERLKLLNKNYQHPINMQISDILDQQQQPAGTKVVFNLPLIQD